MSTSLLPSYATESIHKGAAEPLSTATSLLGFSAMVIEERDLEIDVPPLEFNVLVLMMSSPRDVFTDFPEKKSRIVYRPGDHVLIPAGAPAWFASRPGSHPVLHVHFPDGAVTAFLEEEAKRIPLQPHVRQRDPLVMAAGFRLSEALADKVRNALYLQSLFGVIAYQLAATRPRREAAGSGLTSRQLKRVGDYAMSQLGDDVSLTELAAIVGLSPFHFARAFKRSTGLPPHAWLTQKRIERAQEMMLAHPALPLIEIALCVGYASQTAFGAAFRRITGATPAFWRRERLG